MKSNKKEKIKKITEQATEHRPQTINIAVPRSYFEQGFADINKSRYIPGSEKQDKKSKDKKKANKQKEIEMGR